QLKGEGDAEAVRIYAEAYSKDPEFFEFWRTLEAYKNSISKDSILVLGKEIDFLREFVGEAGSEK
ncbi:MAG: protease modulator HflC, partial [Thermotogae bacterium]|nr:protease modulator HflC [Thermotogota bacterium]